MALISKTIGTAARDYSTLQTWEDSIPADAVAAGNSYEGLAYNDSEFVVSVLPGLTFSGTVTGASNTITLKCAAGQSFYDNASKATNQLKYDATKGVAFKSTAGSGAGLIRISEDYVTVDGFQVSCLLSDGLQQTGTAPNSVFKNCIVEAVGASTGVAAASFQGASVINTVVINLGSGAGVISNGGSAKFRNVTSICPGGGNTTFGFRGNYDSPLYRNCASFGYATCFRSGTDASSDYNVAGDATAPGAHSLQSKTFANQFVDTTNTSARDFRVKAGADLINAGVRDATYTADLDVIKQARSTTTPTIGAWEYSAGAPAGDGVGSATGTSTVTGTGVSTAAGVGSAAGTSTASAVGQAGGTSADGVGSASGASTANAVGTSTNAAAGAASGASTVSGVGAATVVATGAATGTSIATGIAPTIAQGVGSASGSSTANGISANQAGVFGGVPFFHSEYANKYRTKRAEEKEVVADETPAVESTVTAEPDAVEIEDVIGQVAAPSALSRAKAKAKRELQAELKRQEVAYQKFHAKQLEEQLYQQAEEQRNAQFIQELQILIQKDLEEQDEEEAMLLLM